MTTAVISVPGAYNLPDSVYHADPVVEPSLNASIAVTLEARTPRHAWAAHPRLNPAFARETATQFDIGTAAHALVLHDVDGVEVIDVDAYRTKEAKAARQAAYDAGKVPLKTTEYAQVQAMADAARLQMDEHREGRDFFRPGHGLPEQTLIWNEGDVWCRLKLDWQDNNGLFFPDYKTTSGSASPLFWERNLWALAYDFRLAFYRRGIRKVIGTAEPEMRLVVQETRPPYCLCILAVPQAILDEAETRVLRSIKKWAWCLKHDAWPGYPVETCYVQPPPYMIARWEEQAAIDEMSGGADAQLRQAMDWQAPLQIEGDSHV